MVDILAEVTGPLQFVPRGFAMLVAFNTVIAGGKTLDRIESHRKELHDV